MKRAVVVGAWLVPLALPAGCGRASLPGAAERIDAGEARSFGRPTVFARGEGDRLIMRGTRPLFITADPATVGSRTLTAGYEDVPPGDSVRVHKHLGEDEILFIHRGAVEVTLGESTRPAAAGATVFVPRGTWIGMRVVGPDTASFFFVFNTPAFEKCLRMLSARPGEPYRPPAADVAARTSHECHMVLKSG
ncbi:MAG: cupin domain-containing protein [Acetobacteraceae bacterium]|nr:cupin domain-containing protein [Acetobacteraceae bacterium]